MVDYQNIPWSIGTVLSSGAASLRDLDEVLSVEDVHDLIEITAVDSHNRRIIEEYLRKKHEA